MNEVAPSGLGLLERPAWYAAEARSRGMESVAKPLDAIVVIDGQGLTVELLDDVGLSAALRMLDPSGSR